MAITEHYSPGLRHVADVGPRASGTGQDARALLPRSAVAHRRAAALRHGARCALVFVRAVLHVSTINAWEETDTDGNTRIILVGCRIENPLADDPQNPASEGVVPTIGFLRLAPRLHRWTLNLATGGVHEETLDDTLIEFSRMDNRALGYRCRYGYSGRVPQLETIRFDGIVKHDLHRGSSQQFRFAPGWHGGETTFVPRQGSPSDSPDDDGYVLTFRRRRDADLVPGVFAAEQIERGPIGKVRLPRRVPTGYHTYWVPA